MPCRPASPLLRWGAVAVMSAGAGAAVADVAAMAPAAAPVQLVRATFPAAARWDVPVTLAGDGSGRLVFTTLRSVPTLQAIALVDPQGREVWRRTPAELGLVPRGQTPDPSLGDAIVLPEQRLPTPGRWHLRLERATGSPGGLVVLGWQALPRFVLGLWRQAGAPSVHQPMLLTLRPTDMGRAVTDAAGLTLHVQAPSGAPTLMLTPRQDLPAPTGGPVSQEPGAYLAAWRPAAPGLHEIQARWQPPGAAEPLVATQRVDVAPAAAEVRFLEVAAEGLPGCVRGLLLRFAIQLKETPPAGAEHALAVRLQGSTTAWQASAAVRMNGTSGVAELRLPADRLRALGWPLQRITSTQLLRFTPTLAPLATSEAVELDPLLPPAPLCP